MNITLLNLSIIPFIGAAILIIFIASAFVIGMIRNRNFQKKQDLHENLSKSMNLRLAYQNPQTYRAYGKYRGYDITIIPMEFLQTADQSIKYATKLSIGMINPNRKSIRISLPNTPLGHLVPVDQCLKVKHNAQKWLDIYTNDMMFSSLILSEDIKISLGAFFQSDGKDSIVYIQDDELACIFPSLLLNNQQLITYKKALDILCEMKDELN